jgi:peptide-methionine (S)-S-oxide reductase
VAARRARYERVSSGQTGHAEAVKIDYDPRQVSYGQLMQVFFSVVHDPTQLNRQGPDHGSQYRSAIFSDDARQQAASRAYIAQLGQAGSYAPIVTQLVSGQRFYPAESYHQNYMTNYPQAAYIRYYDAEAGRAGQAVPGAVPARCGAGADAVTAFPCRLIDARRCSL